MLDPGPGSDTGVDVFAFRASPGDVLDVAYQTDSTRTNFALYNAQGGQLASDALAIHYADGKLRYAARPD